MSSSHGHASKGEFSRKDEGFSPSLNDLAGTPGSFAFERRLRRPHKWQREESSGSRLYSTTSGAFSATDTLSQTQVSEPITLATTINDEDYDVFRGQPENEARQGYRLLSRPDSKYLGFTPSQSDKRPFLNAVAVVGNIPDGDFMRFTLPVSASQVWTLIIFYTLLALTAVASFFYIRKIEIADNGQGTET